MIIFHHIKSQLSVCSCILILLFKDQLSLMSHFENKMENIVSYLDSKSTQFKVLIVRIHTST